MCLLLLLVVILQDIGGRDLQIKGRIWCYNGDLGIFASCNTFQYFAVVCMR